MFKPIGWWLVAVTVLTGCAGPSPQNNIPAESSAWAQQLRWVQGLRNWRASGRVAVSGAADSGSASLHWRQTAEKFTIRLFGPFGQGAVLIQGQPQSVSLRRAGGDIKHAASAEELLSRELGWSVPVTVLRYWILGRPAPGYSVTEMKLNEEDLLGHLKQAGWQVAFQRYRGVGDGWLPVKIELSRDRLRVRIVVSQWQIPG